MDVSHSEASFNILWQNLIALNSSLYKENTEQKAELLLTKKQLIKEREHSTVLLATNKKQQLELSKRNQKIARLCSKLVAIRQIVSHGSIGDSDVDDDHDHETATLPVIVKVEGGDNLSTMNNGRDNDEKPCTMPQQLMSVDICTECDRKFSSSEGLRRHINTVHMAPTVPCTKCPKKFARQDYVRRHWQRAHPEVGLRRSGRVAK